MKSLLLLLLVGCAGQIEDIGDGDDTPLVDGGTPDGPDVLQCETGRAYTGFGGSALESDRPALAAGADRLRLKPFTAFASEYKRVLGVDVDTTAFAATFGRPAPRWFVEPAASANSLYGAFAMAYEACGRAPLPAAAPTTTTADAQCRQWAHVAWSRDATDAEATACVNYATSVAGTPAQQWAYTCAAVLTTTDFLSY